MVDRGRGDMDECVGTRRSQRTDDQWWEVDLAKIRVYCTVSNHKIICRSKASKGKGTEPATVTRSLFSVVESEFLRRG